jgi:hypothetical protein
MSFLDRFRKKRRQVVDPTFGELTYEPPWWTGRVRFRPCAGDVSINIESDEQGPTDPQRSRYRALDEKYQGLVPLIGAALWDLYRPVRAELEGDRAARLGPNGASEMAEHTELFGIDIRRDGTFELGYSFDSQVGWDDAMFNVAIEGWTPRPVSLDD